jgi:hypothetical protein
VLPVHHVLYLVPLVPGQPHFALPVIKLLKDKKNFFLIINAKIVVRLDILEIKANLPTGNAQYVMVIALHVKIPHLHVLHVKIKPIFIMDSVSQPVLKVTQLLILIIKHVIFAAPIVLHAPKIYLLVVLATLHCFLTLLMKIVSLTVLFSLPYLLMIPLTESVLVAIVFAIRVGKFKN